MAKNQPSTKRDVGGQPDKGKDKDKGAKGSGTKGQGKSPAGGAKSPQGSGSKK